MSSFGKFEQVLRRIVCFKGKMTPFMCCNRYAGSALPYISIGKAAELTVRTGLHSCKAFLQEFCPYKT